MSEQIDQLSPYPWHWAPEDKIAYYAHAYNSLAVSQRIDEILNDQPDSFRIANGYYYYARLNASVTDASFSHALPSEFGQIAAQLEDNDQRWASAGRLHVLIDECLHAAGIVGYVGDHRAKTNFSAWCKTKRLNIDVDEIFDIYGVRLVADDLDQASQIAVVLGEYFAMMSPPYEFRNRTGEVHQPVRGGFNQVNSRHYGSLRMNFVHEGRIFEVQLLTRDLFRQQHERIMQAYAAVSEYPSELYAYDIFDDYKGVTGQRPDVAP